MTGVGYRTLGKGYDGEDDPLSFGGQISFFVNLSASPNVAVEKPT
jgi:hypothetical protein